MTKPRDPFEISLTEEQHDKLALFLCEELQAGLDALGVQEVSAGFNDVALLGRIIGKAPGLEVQLTVKIPVFLRVFDEDAIVEA